MTTMISNAFDFETISLGDALDSEIKYSNFYAKMIRLHGGIPTPDKGEIDITSRQTTQYVHPDGFTWKETADYGAYIRDKEELRSFYPVDYPEGTIYVERH